MSYRLSNFLANTAVYIILTLFAFLMLFPFIFMFTTSFKEPQDTFRYPPTLLPRAALTTEIPGYDKPLPSTMSITKASSGNLPWSKTTSKSASTPRRINPMSPTSAS
jgi:ABC-type glycerol-3-phosphate transport system permease component